MDAQKYLNQIKREAKANPAKASLLLVMCCVLTYVCLPLVVGSKSNKASASTHAIDKNAKSAKPTKTIESKTAAHAIAPQDAPSWRETLETLKTDHFMQPVNRLSGDRDPFAPPPEPKVAEVEGEPEQEPVRAPPPRKLHYTPEEAGLALGSTLQAAQSKVAMINGKPYHVYDRQKTDNRRSVVPFSSDARGEGPVSDAYFVLIDVQQRRVVLWRLGRKHDLKLPGISLANRSANSTQRDQPNPIIPESALSP